MKKDKIGDIYAKEILLTIKGYTQMKKEVDEILKEE